jgi:hypothetical protein
VFQFFWQFYDAPHSSSLRHAIHCSGVEFGPHKFTSFAALLWHFQKCHSHLFHSEESACGSSKNEQAVAKLNIAHKHENNTSNSEIRENGSQHSYVPHEPKNIITVCMRYVGNLQA